MARKSAKFNLLLHFKHLRKQLLDALLELAVGVDGVAAVAVFHPFGALEETAHLLVVAPLGEVTDEENQLVGLAVFAAPSDGWQGAFRTATPRQTVGKQGLYGRMILDVAALGQVVDELHKGGSTSLDNFFLDIEVLNGHHGGMRPFEKVPW